LLKVKHAYLEALEKHSEGETDQMKVGVLSGGGDAPGINAVIRAVVRKGIRHYGYEIVGIRDGWRGLLESEIFSLDLKSASGILPRGGSILGTSRTNPFKNN